VLLAAVIAGCGNASKGGGGGGGDTVDIGLLTSVSGPASVYYPAIKQVTQLAVDEINKSGGVNGKKVRLVTEDTNTTPATAATRARALAQKGVKMAVMEDIVADRDSALPAFTAAKIPFIYAWSYEGGALQGGTDTVCKPNFWATGQVPNNLVPDPITYLVKNKGWKHWFLIGSDYKWPHTTNAHISDAVKAAGGDVVGSQYVPLTATNLSSLVAKVKTLPPDTAIVVNLVGGSLINFYKQWAAAGGKTDRTISFGLDEQVLKAIGPVGKGLWGAYDYYTNGQTPGNKAFLDKLNVAYGDKMVEPTSLSEEGYEAIWLWALAARKAGSFDLSKVNEALPQVSLNGPRDKVQFLPNHHIALPDILQRAGSNGLYTTLVKNFGVIKPADQCPASAWQE
jgi:urea transport system substrate-binding protein